MFRNITIDLRYQPIIEGPPPSQGDIMQTACRGDKPTMDRWRDTWIKYANENKERFKIFGDYSAGKLYNINRNKPAIICGSGPSLKESIPALKENRKLDHPLMTVSCLHNFGYFEDEGCHADYYLTLDSGDIIFQDVYESRKESEAFYWEKTKGKKLFASIMSPPKIFDLWQGEIYLFNIMMPDPALQATIQSVERFSHYFSCGGNALGACLYAAKALMGSDLIHFVGADFCFDYDDKFYSYKTHYDNVGQYIDWRDVYGMPRKTWGSYLGFKFWFDWIAVHVPGRYINCSEGILGAYQEGNIRQFQYMSLEDALLPYKIPERVYIEQRDPQNPAVVLSKDEIRLKKLFETPDFNRDLVLF